VNPVNRLLHLAAAVEFALAVSALPLRAAEIADGLPEYSVTSWTEAAGRPLGSVYAIVQAGDGYLWIGSDAGLFRFDGWRFSPWTGEGGRGLPSSAPVTVVEVRRGGGLWIAFANVPGLYEVSDGRSKVVGDSETAMRRVTAVAQESDGTLWAVADSALLRLRNSRWEQLQVGNETRGSGMFPYLVNVRASGSGPLWVTSTEGLFRHKSGSSFERVTGDPNQSRDLIGAWVWDVAEAADGSLWTTHLGAGFKQRPRDAGGWLQPPVTAKGYRLLMDRSGNAWVGTIGEGVWRVSAGHGTHHWTVERMTLGTGLSSNSVQSLMEDRDGNVWVGTTAGMHRLTQHQLTPISDIGLVVSVEAAPDGAVLVSTFNGLVTFQDGSRDLKARSSAAAGYWIMRVHRDHNNALWVGSTSGLFRSSDGGRTLVPVMPDALVGSLASDGHGTVWIVVKRQLYRTTREGRVSRFEVPPSSGITGVTNVFGDSTGRLWVTDADGHLGLMDEAGTLHAVAVGSGVSATGRINTIFEDHEHTLWLGTDKGLGRLLNGDFELLGPGNGLPSDRIGAITEDDYGCLWLNVDTSLIRLARGEFAKAVRTSTYRPNYTSYDASDGLSGAAIVNLRAARAADGSLWFVRGGGLTVVDPRRLAAAPPHQPHATRIDAVVADDLTLSPADGSSVPSGTKTVQITYSALELTSPQRLRFRYRLDGFDSDWIAAGTARQARYTNLPPGRYTFRVEAQAAGDGSVDTSAWRFSLEPKFNQTRQFYAAIFALLVALLYAAWWVRLRVVQHEFSIVLAERTRLSREMHDTLLQSLVGLTLQIDKAVRLVRTSPASAADQLVRMRKLVESNIRDARTSIWELRSPVLESRDLITALTELGQRLTAEEDVAFTATVIGSSRDLPPNVKNNLLRIGQEAIANAVCHADPRTIAVELCFDAYNVTLRVTDDGQGFTPHFSDDAAGHYGLLNMRDRAKEIGGVLSISSTADAGSVVEARIPLEEWPIEVRQRTA
jgi:signal transduction histidine kinase/ligand-binding sensor domain-containing protein